MFDAADTVGKSMRILAGVISTLTVRSLSRFLLDVLNQRNALDFQIFPEKMAKSLTPDMLATDLAEYLVRKGVRPSPRVLSPIPANSQLDRSPSERRTTSQARASASQSRAKSPSRTSRSSSSSPSARRSRRTSRTSSTLRRASRGGTQRGERAGAPSWPRLRASRPCCWRRCDAMDLVMGGSARARGFFNSVFGEQGGGDGRLAGMQERD